MPARRTPVSNTLPDAGHKDWGIFAAMAARNLPPQSVLQICDDVACKRHFIDKWDDRCELVAVPVPNDGRHASNFHASVLVTHGYKVHVRVLLS